MTTALVWFRSDLRLHDHAPLVEAAQSAAVAPVYVVDRAASGETDVRGFPRTGPFRARFLAESVADLRRSLRRVGTDLVILRGDPAEALAEFASEHRVEAVHYHRELGTEEVALEARVTAELGSRGVRTVAHWALTQVDLRDFPFELKRTPELFTDFRKMIESSCTPARPIAPPEVLPKWEGQTGELPTPEDWGATTPDDDDRAVLRFEGGETAGLARLQRYLWDDDSIATYKETRNGSVGAEYSTKFSPWLAAGCLSPRQVRAEVDRYETERVQNRSTYWVTFELLWRDYFQLILAKHGAKLFRPSGLRGHPVPWRRDEGAFEAWRRGRTGFPIVDASMRELLLTGFLSNRSRQIVASFLTKNLGVDWRWGAEWFESQLVDYDVASNYGNWNYTAGVGNDARGFRYFDLRTQARKYDPSGDYARLWCHELAELPGFEAHQVFDRPARKRLGVAAEYPAPIVDLDASVTENRRAWEAAAGKRR